MALMSLFNMCNVIYTTKLDMDLKSIVYIVLCVLQCAHMVITSKMLD